jgi:hypothetical protein
MVANGVVCLLARHVWQGAKGMTWMDEESMVCRVVWKWDVVSFEKIVSIPSAPALPHYT